MGILLLGAVVAGLVGPSGGPISPALAAAPLTATVNTPGTLTPRATATIKAAMDASSSTSTPTATAAPARPTATATRAGLAAADPTGTPTVPVATATAKPSSIVTPTVATTSTALSTPTAPSTTTTPTVSPAATAKPSSTVTPTADTTSTAVSTPTVPSTISTPTASPTSALTGTLPTATPPGAAATGTAPPSPTGIPTGTLTISATASTATVTPTTATTTPTQSVTPTVSPTGTVTLGPTGTATTRPTGTVTVSPTGTLTATATASPTTTPTATPVPLRAVSVTRKLSGPGAGEHRVSPGGTVTVELTVTADGDLPGAVLAETVPTSWHVVSASGATVSAGLLAPTRISWNARDVPLGGKLQVTYTVQAPAEPNLSPTQPFQSEVSYGGRTATAGPWLAIVSSPVVVDRYRFGKDRPLSAMEWYAAVDTPLDSMTRFEPFRIRFQVSNRDTMAARWTPRLEWSTQPDAGFQTVPVDDPKAPFYVRRSEWIVAEQTIATSALGLGPGTGTPAAGTSFDGPSDAAEQTIGPEAYTEIELNARATANAEWQRPYYFRLTDAGTVLSGGSPVKLPMGSEPQPRVLQPEYSGRPASSSDSPNRTARASAATVDSSLLANRSLTAHAIDTSPGHVNPHTTQASTPDQCAGCHRTHTGGMREVLRPGDPQSVLCFTCHNGTGADTNVQAQYSDTSVPPNDPGASVFYSHPATAPNSGHMSALSDEFAGVLNRHSECGDCHNPHRADPALSPTMAANGWTASGAIYLTTGLRVANGSAGSSPSYTWLSTEPGITYEYEQCFKCHSGHTQLPTSSSPSDKVLDKGKELNPANASYHPIEAAGKNSSAALALQLSEPSPFKLWNFGSGDRVRCVNCHGNYRLADPLSPPAANARLAPHTSRYRGLLMNNYEDRQLTASGAAYSPDRFALCYQCHGEEPFGETAKFGGARGDTDFRFHGYHLANTAGQGGGGSSSDIDTAGAGQGNALCAECHFRTHGTTGAVNSGDQNNSRLVNFAPDVTRSTQGAGPAWDAANKTCTLTCHGQNHEGYSYAP